jgi:hypothetical protein
MNLAGAGAAGVLLRRKRWTGIGGERQVQPVEGVQLQVSHIPLSGLDSAGDYYNDHLFLKFHWQRTKGSEEPARSLHQLAFTPYTTPIFQSSPAG